MVLIMVVGLNWTLYSLAGHTYIRRRGMETPLPSANLEPETLGTYTRAHTRTHTHTLSLSLSLCTTGTGAD